MKAASRALVAMARRGKAGAAVAVQVDRWRTRAGGAPTEVPGREELYEELWRDAAAAAGAVVEEVGSGFLRLRRGGRAALVWNQHVPLDDPVSLRLAADKVVSTRLLRAAGFTVPDHQPFTLDDLRSVRRFVTDGGPCVVKPAAGTGAGAGVTCGVRTDDDLARAAARAARWSPALLVERQATGRELRLLVLDGRVLGALARDAPTVVGDGRSSLAELVVAENERRVAARGRAGLWRLALDLDAELALQEQGLTPRAVPVRGREVRVGTTANENGPADNHTVAPSDALCERAAAAAAVFGLRLASVELVVAGDPADPGAAGDGVVVEVNGTPGLHYHAQVADPSTRVDVAVPILETILGDA